MRQGEIWEMYFDPTEGREQSGRRPALILSGNLLNTHLDVVIVCPLTTKVKNYKGNVVLEPTKENGITKRSEILLFHIRSVAKSRLKKRLGVVEDETIDKLKTGLSEILRY